MTRRRVVITGIGAITPMGSTAEGLWAGVMAARSAVRTAELFDTSQFACHIAAEVPDFNPDDWFERKRQRRLDRYSMFGLACARMAIQDAGLELETEDRDRIGCTIGSALGGVGIAEAQFGAFLRGGPRAVNPALATQVYVGAAPCNIAIENGLSGPVTSNCDSCASGTIAIGRALRLIQHGEADVMLAGGAEAPLQPLCFGAFALVHAMSTRNDEPEKACRPFDRERNGFVMGEGAAILVLEERDRALARGARVYGEVLGYGVTNDAYGMMAPDPDATQSSRCITLALRDGNVAPDEVDHVNAHASSTPLNDAIETLAIKRTLGQQAYRVGVSGTKSMHGHSLGAVGAIEAAISALAMQHGILPPTVNLDCPDEGLDLDYVPHHPRPARVDTVLSNSFGFGGINAALVFGKRD